MEYHGYTNIPDWMLSLELDVYETIVLAVIYGFSQDGESTFKGTQNYLARKAKCSKRKVGSALVKLVDRKLIQKIDLDIRGVHLCEYRVTDICIGCNSVARGAGGVARDARGIARGATNNIEDNIDIIRERNKGNARFCKPTVSEIATYCKERGNNVDAEDFYNFYESKGWVIGKSPMKDWKACVRTWEKSRSQTNANSRKMSVLDNNLMVAEQLMSMAMEDNYEPLDK